MQLACMYSSSLSPLSGHGQVLTMAVHRSVGVCVVAVFLATSLLLPFPGLHFVDQ